MSKFLDLDGLDYFTRNYIKPQLTEIIDGGVKNKINLYDRFSSDHITIVDGDNGSITMSTTQEWSASGFFFPVISTLGQNTNYILIIYADETNCVDVNFQIFVNSCTSTGVKINEITRIDRIIEARVYTTTFNTGTNDYIRININLNKRKNSCTMLPCCYRCI